MPSSHLICCHPLLLLPSTFSSIRVFSNESALRIRWPKYWSFSFNISPSNEHPGLISFRMDWLDLLAVQGTLKSLLQYRSSKASILWCSAFFTVQLSHPHMTTGKTIALTRQTFVGKVMSQLFNMLSRLVLGVKIHLPMQEMQETQFQSLSQEDPLEKEMETHYSILAWKIPWTEDPGRILYLGSQRVKYDWVHLMCFKGGRNILLFPPSLRINLGFIYGLLSN